MMIDKCGWRGTVAVEYAAFEVCLRPTFAQQVLLEL